MWLSGLFLCYFILDWGYADDTITLHIPQGTLIGIETMTAYHNKTYYSFRSIPYVKPNLGPDKFNAPQSAEPWEGVLNATQYSEACTFYNQIFESVEGDEDCLYMNVNTPVISNDTCKAVMVWIHGGGFNFGSSNADVYGPDFLMERDVVVASFNYRLGPIGFLSTADENLPGNVGLKDQVYALRWIRDNIKYFGGCSNKVTLFGQSAGASSVQFHLISPMSRGLFQSGIQQSGSATDSWAFNYYPKKAAFELGKSLGIHTNDSRKLVEELKKLSTENIVKASAKTFESSKGVPSVMIPFIPCVEPVIEGQETFLEDNPINLIVSGEIADVPMIMGINADEGAFFFTNIVNMSKILISDNTELQCDLVIRDNMNITDPSEREKFRKEIYEFYFGSQSIKNFPHKKMVEIISDVFFINQHYITSTIIGLKNKSPLFKYVLSYRTSDAMFRPIFQVKDEEVSMHSDDLEYLWYSDMFGNIPDVNTTTEKMYHLISKMWTNFAKYGDPTFELDDIVNVKWEPANKMNNILNINVQPKMEGTYASERMAFWIKNYKRVLGKYADKL